MLAFGLGWGEIVVIMLVILLLFGAKKLPELAKGMGKGIREFKKASSDISDELHRASYEEEEQLRQDRQLDEQTAEVEEGREEKKKKAARAKSSPDSKA